MTIRDFVVTAMVLVILPMALRHPYIGVLLWTWLSIMNPHKLAWGFATSMPFAAMAAAATLISLVFTKDKVSLGSDGLVRLLIVFVVWMAFTTLVALDRPESMAYLNKVLKIQLMTLVAVAVLHQRAHLEAFIWVNVLSLAFFGVKGGIYTALTGGTGRVWGPPGGFIEGNNELATALAMTIPLMYYLRHVSKRTWVRHALLLAMLLSVVSAIGTQSRGALLAMGAMGALLWWRSSSKFATLIPIVLMGLLIFTFMPESWHERMGTIREYEDDGSAMGRINTWGVMLEIANHRITGGGFGIYSPEVFAMYTHHKVLAAHSIYFQVLGEQGWVGLVLFLSIWLAAWIKAARIRRVAKRTSDERGELGVLAAMCQVSIVGYLVGGAFLSLAYFDLPYNILVMLIVAYRLLLQPATERSPAAEKGPASTEFPVSRGRLRGSRESLQSRV